MKSIRLHDRIQKSISNDSMYWFNDLLRRVFKYPGLVLLVVWGVYFLLDLITTLVVGKDVDWAFALSNLFFGLSFSFLMYYLLLPHFFLDRKWAGATIYTLASVVVLSAVKFYVIFFGQLEQLSFVVIWLEFIRLFQFQGVTFLIWIVLVVFLLLEDSKEKKHLLNEMEVQHKSMQLGPHFVMNMLAEIRSKAKLQSELLFEEIEQFSIVLRYSYKKLEMENSLWDELAALQAYIYCQYRRFADRLKMDCRFKVDQSTARDLPLPKMVVLTLFFDIFKHGDYLNEAMPCQVTCSLSDPEIAGSTLFTFSIYNLKMNQYSLEDSGFGFKTVDLVLSYYFEENYQLFADTTENEFSLLLLIDYG